MWVCTAVTLSSTLFQVADSGSPEIVFNSKVVPRSPNHFGINFIIFNNFCHVQCHLKQCECGEFAMTSHPTNTPCCVPAAFYRKCILQVRKACLLPILLRSSLQSETLTTLHLSSPRPTHRYLWLIITRTEAGFSAYNTNLSSTHIAAATHFLSSVLKTIYRIWVEFCELLLLLVSHIVTVRVCWWGSVSSVVL